jgi:NAD(P)H-flavin reductase
VQPLLQKYENDLDMEIVYCVDKVTTNRAKYPELICGTVVDAFEAQSCDSFNGEAYVCGNPYMVQNVVQMLHRKGVTKIFW